MNNKLRYIQIIVGVVLITVVGFYIYLRFFSNNRVSQPTTSSTLATNYQPAVFSLKTVEDKNFSVRIPEYFDKITYDAPESQDYFAKDRDYAIHVFSSQSEVEFDIAIIKTNQQSISDWEKNECKSEEFCKSYDSKDRIIDRFDEHHRYSRSGLSWDNIRNKNIIFSISVPYKSGRIDETSMVLNYLINTLSFKNN